MIYTQTQMYHLSLPHDPYMWNVLRYQLADLHVVWLYVISFAMKSFQTFVTDIIVFNIQNLDLINHIINANKIGQIATFYSVLL